MRLLLHKILLIILAVSIAFAGAGFVHAQLNDANTLQKPINIRGSEANTTQESVLREPCTLLPIAHMTHGSDHAYSFWVEYDLGSVQNVTAVLLDNSEAANTSKSTYVVFTGSQPRPGEQSGKVEVSNGANSIYIPFTNAAAQVSFVRIEQSAGAKNSAALEHALICGEKNTQAEWSKVLATTTSNQASPTITPPPTANCPGGDLYLSKTELVVGETLTAIAPPMWYDGVFKSSNTGIVVIDGNIVRAAAPGTAQVYGVDFKGGNSRGCVTKAIAVTVK